MLIVTLGTYCAFGIHIIDGPGDDFFLKQCISYI